MPIHRQLSLARVTTTHGSRQGACQAPRRGAWLRVLAAGLLLAGTGCSTVTSRLTSRYTGGMLQALYAQPDPELVRQGAPAFMLAMDGLLASSPNDPQLLQAATRAYTAYCQAFLSRDEDRPRAALLYGRAHEYGQRLLCQYKTFARTKAAPQEDYEQALLAFEKRDVPALYAAGSAWLGWILANSDSMQAVAELPKALALMQRVLALDPACENGAGQLLFGIYYAAQPAGAGQDLPRSRAHFEEAIRLGGPGSLLPQVAYCEFYGKATLDETLFRDGLTRLLGQNPEERPELRLLNAVARERARQLLAHAEDYF